MDETIDPTALALKRSIFKAEGGSYSNTSGDNGTSAGAGQWNNGKIPLKSGEIPAHFKSAAQQFGLDPNDFSETAQDHVGYLQIKHDLDSGLTQSQIAAKWNSGLTHGWESHVGDTVINGKTVHYDTPSYVSEVQKYYEQEMNGENPTNNQPSQTRKTFTESIPSDTPSGKEPTASGKLIRGLIKGSGVPSLVASGANLVQTIEGKPETDTFHNSYLGDVSRVGKGFDPAKGFFGKENKENRKAVLDSAEKGVGLATTISGGEGLLNAGKSVAKKGLIGALKGSSVFESPAVVENLKNIGLKNPVEDFKAFSNAEKVEMLTESMKNANTVDKAVIQQALDKVLPQAVKDAGGKIAFSQLHPKLAKIPSIIKSLTGVGTTVGLLEAVNKLNK